MTDINLTVDQFGPEQKFSSIKTLTQSIETEFISLGELLSDIKNTKLFLFKGYEKFNEFMSSEYNFSPSLANKLISIYNLFVREMDVDEETLKEIGFDRLCIIKPTVAKAAWDTREEWVKKASETPAKDLKAEIKELKKEEDPDLKDILVEQTSERLVGKLNCSAKELKFKLALFFNAMDESALIEMVALVKKLQRKFEMELAGAREL